MAEVIRYIRVFCFVIFRNYILVFVNYAEDNNEKN